MWQTDRHSCIVNDVLNRVEIRIRPATMSSSVIARQLAISWPKQIINWPTCIKLGHVKTLGLTLLSFHQNMLFCMLLLNVHNVQCQKSVDPKFALIQPSICCCLRPCSEYWPINCLKWQALCMPQMTSFVQNYAWTVRIVCQSVSLCLSYSELLWHCTAVRA